jgi:hypothetical protein
MHQNQHAHIMICQRSSELSEMMFFHFLKITTHRNDLKHIKKLIFSKKNWIFWKHGLARVSKRAPSLQWSNTSLGYTIIIHKFHVIHVEIIFVSLIYLVANRMIICDIIILFGRISNVHMSQRLCEKNIFSKWHSSVSFNNHNSMWRIETNRFMVSLPRTPVNPFC